MIHTYALTSLANLKEYLGIVANDEDSLLTNIINRSTDIIEKYCGRRFKETTYTEEEYNGSGTTKINATNFPITAVTSKQRNYGTAGDANWDDLQDEFFKYLEDEGQFYYQVGFNKGTKNYRFTYTAGYSTIPSDVEEACLALCSHVYTDRKNKGMQSESLGEYSYTKFRKNGNLVEDLGLDLVLDYYRTPVLR